MTSLYGRIRLHPWHPPTTHFPIALLSTSLLWDVLAVCLGAAPWRELAYWSQLAGLGFAALAVTLGMVDALRYVWTDSPPPRSATARLTQAHLALMLLGIALFGSSFYFRSRPGEVLAGVIVLSSLGTLAMVSGAWLGGLLVYAEGVGTLRESRH